MERNHQRTTANTVAGRMPESFEFEPFAYASCTTLCAPTADEQAAYAAFYRTCESAQTFWNDAPASDWMLDLLRKIGDPSATRISAGLRRFALRRVEGLSSAGAPQVETLLEVVRRHLHGAATLDDLRRARAAAHASASAGGVHGLPRCSAYAAAVLAAWHAADPNPDAAASWSAEFAARHDAFLVLHERAASWHWPDDRGEHWRDSWRAAYFGRAHPEVQAVATAEARRRQADLLRAALPDPFRPPLRIGFRRDDNGSPQQ